MLFLSKKFNGHPTCYVLKGLQLPTSRPIAGGGFGDVYRGNIYFWVYRWSLPTRDLGILRGEDVCMKTVRLFQDSQVEDLLKVFLTIHTGSEELLLSLITFLVFSPRSHNLEIPQSSQYLALLGYLLPWRR
jgi:hypothetical protein